jgi:hypothetical protein
MFPSRPACSRRNHSFDHPGLRGQVQKKKLELKKKGLKPVDFGAKNFGPWKAGKSGRFF